MRPLGLGWPNVLSIGRIGNIPVVVVLLGSDDEATRWAAFVVFVVGALSDLVDGHLARRHAMTTSVGAWLDPLSDKLFVIVPATVLSMTASSRGGRRRHRPPRDRGLAPPVAAGPTGRVDAGVARREGEDVQPGVGGGAR